MLSTIIKLVDAIVSIAAASSSVAISHTAVNTIVMPIPATIARETTKTKKISNENVITKNKKNLK